MNVTKGITKVLEYVRFVLILVLHVKILQQVVYPVQVLIFCLKVHAFLNVGSTTSTLMINAFTVSTLAKDVHQSILV